MHLIQASGSLGLHFVSVHSGKQLQQWLCREGLQCRWQLAAAAGGKQQQSSSSKSSYGSSAADSRWQLAAGGKQQQVASASSQAPAVAVQTWVAVPLAAMSACRNMDVHLERCSSCCALHISGS
jgi:hypothetical protein